MAWYNAICDDGAGVGRVRSFTTMQKRRRCLVVITWVVYLALPFSLHPTFIVLPFATVFALAVAVTASTFKKYL
ncbi:MAG: DUF4400 domain-containing protein [Thiogranum sp.]